ncbi:MAG: glycerate kinase [Phycisphaerae bacterium]
MKIVIAMDSFKGTLTSLQAGRAVAMGIDQAWAGDRICILAVADGGEGTTEAVNLACGGTWQVAEIMGPLGDPVQARYLIAELPASVVGVDSDRPARAAVIEMAAASGLGLLEPERYDPLKSTTFGTGQLIDHALRQDVEAVLIGAGGSATVDGGCGAGQALGVRFADAGGATLSQPTGGGDLKRIDRIEVRGLHPLVRDRKLSVLCDVNNPLCGPDGAAATFGPQKGADAKAVARLERNLRHLARLMRRDLDAHVANLSRAGAAGGLSAGLYAFAGARLRSGAETILDLVGLDQHLAGADLVVTGEGCLDGQSVMGKLVGAVAERAKRAGVRIIAIAGRFGPDADACHQALAGCYAVCDSAQAPPKDAGQAARLLTQRTAKVFGELPRGSGSDGGRVRPV